MSLFARQSNGANLGMVATLYVIEIHCIRTMGIYQESVSTKMLWPNQQVFSHNRKIEIENLTPGKVEGEE